MNKYTEIIKNDGSQKAPLKTWIIYYINQILFYYLMVLLLGFWLFKDLFDNYVFLIIIAASMKLIFLFLFSFEMRVISRSVRPEYMRFFFHKDAKKILKQALC